ncbi:hypothetical protein ACH35V_29655 [Actinomadura sp. 1N219]|uniref:hypothetical protein n=1 Tax=Actinomadura sp. 1N219 TaxID=3375152 RepID=UPI0037BC80AB
MTTPQPAPPSAQRWEHAFLTYRGYPEEINQMLAAYSADGWELVSHAAGQYSYSFTFKRPWVPR